MEENSKDKHSQARTQARAVQGWMTSWEEGWRGREKRQSLVCSGLDSAGMGDSPGRGMPG